MRFRTAILLLALSAAACSQPGGPYPSLEPRSAEFIDPRVHIETAMQAGAVDAALAAQLAALVAQALAGDAAFEDAASIAERLIAAAGPPQSESWVVAQQAVSVAVSARGPTARAIGDIDEIAAAALAQRGWIAPADRAAIEAAAAEVGELDRAQAARVDAMRARLGS